MTVPTQTTKKIDMPDAFVILLFIVLIAWSLTYFIPAGSFELITDSTGKTQIQASSFTYQNETASGLPLFATDGQMGLFNYAFEGLASGDRMGSAIGVMMFILIVGGAFGIIMATGAINNGIMAFIAKTQHLQTLIIPAIFLLFSLAGAVFGMGEEAIAFCIVLYPLMLALGYDGITTVMITYVATQIGFATSWMNPFSVAIAQGLAAVPVMSGTDFRLVMWGTFTLLGIGFTMRYAAKIKAFPNKSLSFDTDSRAQMDSQQIEHAFDWTDRAILITFSVGIMWVI